MISIDLEPELEMTLEAVAKQEQSSPGEIIKRLINFYITQKKDSGLLTDLVNDLPEIDFFKNKDPLIIQRALRDEWT
jgi:hypothetical protein